MQIIGLDGSFPAPSAAARADAGARLAAIGNGETVLIDGLALGVIPEIVTREQNRLRLFGLVHHPLADESGHTPARVAELRASERAALAAMSQVVVTSDATAARLATLGVRRTKISVIEPGTDPAPLAGRSRRWPLRLLCVGALIPRKGHRVLIDALARLQERRWRLQIVGSLARDPSTVAQVVAQLEATGLGSQVTLSGALSDAALRRAYRRADLFVLASLYEGYGMAFSEAIAHGLPIIGSGAGAVQDTVPRDAGVLVEPGSSTALAAALDETMRDRGRLGELAAGAARARGRLPDWPSRHRRWSRLLTGERVPESRHG